jgi:hypothetical protein
MIHLAQMKKQLWMFPAWPSWKLQNMIDMCIWEQKTCSNSLNHLATAINNTNLELCLKKNGFLSSFYHFSDYIWFSELLKISPFLGFVSLLNVLWILIISW